jgi:hypothetical protein
MRGDKGYDFILAHGKEISSQEVRNDVCPIDWGEDVLSGKYKNKAIILSNTNKKRYKKVNEADFLSTSSEIKNLYLINEYYK